MSFAKKPAPVQRMSMEQYRREACAITFVSYRNDYPLSNARGCLDSNVLLSSVVSKTYFARTMHLWLRIPHCAFPKIEISN